MTGTGCAQALINLPAVQAGHLPVAQDRVVMIPVKQAQAGFAVGDHVHGVAMLLQHLGNHLQNGLLVINDENFFARAFMRVRLARCRQTCRAGGIFKVVGDGQFDDKFRALAGTAAGRDVAAVLLDDAIA